MFARLGAVMIFTPSFVLPAVAIAAFGGWLGQVYIKAQLSVKREMSTAKAPVLGILGGAIAGLRMSACSSIPSDRLCDLLCSFNPCIRCSGSLQERDDGPH